ncbi:hypothetical protein [Chryseobacterium sp. PMSZPI]|uniref:hypothetical protein n=1 Tax=Chryseobacterium sp. PMSZPI TaxID=1033900 RepID=UPI000C32C04A|nr:hypothetical protein [Chryseobacterium sp. PMSZPI]PKF75176.1 hypothetical protein CW752_06005 [Chryseobacterium sp. PMSZPI]
METNVQHQEQLQCAEVYISDMWALKSIFLQLQNTQKVNQDFGIPFLLAKKKNKIVSFASLILKEGGIGFKIYPEKEISGTDEKKFFTRVESYFKKNNTPNFRNEEQLKSSIQKMISWLNQ